MRKLVYIVILIGFNSICSLKAQSLTGTRGLIKTPTARLYESGTLAIGMGFVPAKFFKRTFGEFQGLRSGNPGLNTFITLSPLPFMEIMFRYTHELNLKVNPITTYFPDRMFTARFKLIEEKRNRPAILLGLQDISAITETTCETCSNFTATYLVASKIFKFKEFTFDVSLGYAADLIKLPAKDFKGIFGGVEIKYRQFDKTQFLIDYDKTSFNLGLQGFLFNRFHTIVGIMNFKPMYLVAYRYKI